MALSRRYDVHAGRYVMKTTPVSDNLSHDVFYEKHSFYLPGRSMKSTTIILPVLLAATLGLAGCDQAGRKAIAKPAGALACRATFQPEDVAAAKLDLYSHAYQVMMTGQTSLRPSFDGFIVRLKNAGVNEDIVMSPNGRLEYALELFRQGYAIRSGDMPELDENVLGIIGAGSRLIAQKDEPDAAWNPENRQKDDWPGQGGAVYTSVETGYRDLFTALDRIETLLFRYRKIESEKRMAAFRKAADPLGFYTERSLADAQELLALFIRSDRAVNDSATYEQGDVILSGLEESLARQRKAYEHARAADTERIEKYPAVHRILTSMIGSYRNLRQSRTLSDLSALNKKYHEAIGANRRLSMLSH